MFWTRLPISLGIKMSVESAAFVIGSLSHMPLKIGPIDEPKIVPAMIVESICAVALAAGASKVLRRSDHAWEAALAGQGIAAAGAVLGVVALAAGRGPRTTLNNAFHAAVLACSAVGILVLIERREAWRTG
jgi:hypothetical protein